MTKQLKKPLKPSFQHTASTKLLCVVASGVAGFLIGTAGVKLTTPSAPAQQMTGQVALVANNSNCRTLDLIDASGERKTFNIKSAKLQSGLDQALQQQQTVTIEYQQSPHECKQTTDGDGNVKQSPYMITGFKTL